MRLVLLTYCLLLSLFSFGISNSKFHEGNDAYSHQEYALALEKYSQLVSEGYHSAELYYNLGNTHYQLSEIGKAIWSYEKALEIDPSFEDARFNLDFVNMLTVDQIDQDKGGLGSWFKGIFFSQSINFWAYMSALMSILLATSLVLFFRSRQRKLKNLSMLLGSVFGLLLLFTLLTAHFHKGYIQDQSNGIIIVESTAVRLSPLEEAQLSFELHEGSKVQIIGSNAEWVEVEVNENTGWMLKEDLWEI
ncbi:MAG: tetratricopeptide repeat protein [Flavobacteriales bacterium]|jgi:tetratricopeptide (TPR) repeat protein|nr:tetratricopeptide repeat protein [Flavobacteriales bacterium]